MRIGHGIDIHKFSNKNNPLIIGGITIPHNYGLIAHSDGDVMLHSIIDAILGALSLGDIGKFFPNDNLIYKNYNSRMFLKKVWQKVIIQGYHLGNLDISFIAQEPKISKYVFDMKKCIANDLSCHVDNISIKSTTAENLGFIGRNEGVVCESIVLLLKNNN